MIIGFVGKGGSGKSTLAALYASYLHQKGKKVLVIDADVNMHAGLSLGIDQETQRGTPALGDMGDLLRQWVSVSNPRINSPQEVLKSTPPTRSSQLIGVHDSSPVIEACTINADGIRVIYAGELGGDDAGVSCFHKYTGTVQVLLNHLDDKDDEFAIIDMTAGTDAIGGGLTTPLDIALLVVEPTLRSVAAFKQFYTEATAQGTRVLAIGNKVRDIADVDFLKDEVGKMLVAVVGASEHVADFERGRVSALSAGELSDEDRAAFDAVYRTHGAEAPRKERYERILALHLKLGKIMERNRPGVDWLSQIDDDYMP
jgi:CO dehydrogenase maturation factor